MRRSVAIVLAAAFLAACDSKSTPTVDITRGGTKAMERAQDVSKVLEQGANRAREAEDASAASEAMKKGY
jgi:hypothetical protein